MYKRQIVNFKISATLIEDYIELFANESIIIRVHDKTGRELKKKKIMAGTQRIPMGELPSDVYFVVVTNDTGVSETIQILKK